MKVFILTKYFEPGYKAGGPIRSLSNLVDHLGKDFSLDFFLFIDFSFLFFFIK